jgi:hypothetical protein
MLCVLSDDCMSLHPLLLSLKRVSPSLSLKRVFPSLPSLLPSPSLRETTLRLIPFIDNKILTPLQVSLCRTDASPSVAPMYLPLSDLMQKGAIYRRSDYFKREIPLVFYYTESPHDSSTSHGLFVCISPFLTPPCLPLSRQGPVLSCPVSLD